jgi:TatD DNase family protein
LTVSDGLAYNQSADNVDNQGDFMPYVDVHCHLTHESFRHDLDFVIKNTMENKVEAVVVNGLDAQSNRAVLEMAERYPVVKPALGIYPVYALCHKNINVPFEMEKFDIDDELKSIAAAASLGKIAAIGECGLDGYWVDESTFAYQEEVFIALIEIARCSDLPIIVHSRKREERAIEVLEQHGAKKVLMHCFGGKVALAKKAAEQLGYWFSIPANAARSEHSKKMIEKLPIEKILTETDAPYLAPVAHERNMPANVKHAIEVIAKVRQLSPLEAENVIWSNYLELFKAEK